MFGEISKTIPRQNAPMALDQHDLQEAVRTHLGHLVGEEPGYGTSSPGSRTELLLSGGVGPLRRAGRGFPGAIRRRWPNGGAVPTIDGVSYRLDDEELHRRDAACLCETMVCSISMLMSSRSFPSSTDQVGTARCTVRHLMTMSAGFPTDDPWGDRQQALDVGKFRSFIADRLAPAWRPGECFEYSNLGYAMLGLVIERVTGRLYRDAVRERVLDRFGLSDTGFDVDRDRPRSHRRRIRAAG